MATKIRVYITILLIICLSYLLLRNKSFVATKNSIELKTELLQLTYNELLSKCTKEQQEALEKACSHFSLSSKEKETLLFTPIKKHPKNSLESLHSFTFKGTKLALEFLESNQQKSGSKILFQDKNRVLAIMFFKDLQ